MCASPQALSVALIDSLFREEVRFSILHRADDLERGRVETDLDLVVGSDPMTVIRRLTPALDDLGLLVIMVWRYDAGATRTFFLATEDLSAGIQLDLLHDPRGVGKYGIRSDRLLAATTRDGVRWPRLSNEAEFVYLVRKRLVKGQLHRAIELISDLQELDRDHLNRLADRLLVPRAAEAVKAAVRGSVKRAPSATPFLTRWVRLLTRLRRPTGAWIHVDTRSLAVVTDLEARLSRILPSVRLANGPSPVSALRAKALTRRPAAFITHGGHNRWADVVAAGEDPHRICAAVAVGLANLADTRWGIRK
jgi:hypothetical protein